MKLKFGIVVTVIFLLGFNASFASAGTLGSHAKQKFKSNALTEVTIRAHQKNTVNTFKSSFVPVRCLFGRTAQQISWDHQSKTASVKSNGKTLVFSTKEIQETNTRMVWPKDWFLLEDGKAYVNIIYLNQIFDRNESYESGSEERKWAKKLEFLGISYIDSIYGGKDSMVHVFVSFDPES